MVRSDQSTICRDHFCRAQVIAAEPELSVQPADAAVKGETAMPVMETIGLVQAGPKA